jgi:cephalosporin hydroxylase
MNWVPIAINRATMLYLTVLGAPALLAKLDVIETGVAIAGSAVFFAGVVKLAFLYAARKASKAG